MLQLQRELAQKHPYRVVDLAPAQELLRHLRSQHKYAYRFDDCAERVGWLLGALTNSVVVRADERLRAHARAAGRPSLDFD